VSRGTAALAGRKLLAGQFFGQREQRVRRAVHHRLGDAGDLLAAGPGHIPKQIERGPRLEPVPLGQDADGLLDPDPRGQRVLELGHRYGQPRRLVGFVGRSSGGRSGRTKVGGQQVGEHHGTGQVGGLLRPDLPALP
jgi:hypothetical protein